MRFWSSSSWSRSPSQRRPKLHGNAARALGEDDFAPGAVESVHGGARGPQLGAGITRIDVERVAAAGAFAAVAALGGGLHGGEEEERPAGGGIAEAEPLLVEALLDGDDLKAGIGRFKVADMQRVAVTPAGGVEAGAVVVDDRGAVDDLVAAVVVHVGDAQLVVTLAPVLFVARGAVIGIEDPARGQLSRRQSHAAMTARV
jgi:hypothetical protein